jgi:hypothetical protein
MSFRPNGRSAEARRAEESSSRLGPRDAVLGICPGGQQMTNIYHIYILWESPMPSAGSAVAFGAGLAM